MNKLAHLTKKVKYGGHGSLKSGFLLINKPAGPTSHDVVDELRRITLIRQIGHAGTLDPFASGLLLVGVGEATKLLRHYAGLDKKYEAVLRLGAVSDTYDRTGKITNMLPDQSSLSFPRKRESSANRDKVDSFLVFTGTKGRGNDKEKIEKVLQSFIGKQKQIPPMYSAKKVAGRKLYEFARRGEVVPRKPIDIEVYDIKLITYSLSLITCSFHVSSGAYIRALAHDIGQKLGVGAYLEELKRTAIGEFKLEDAINVIARSPVSCRETGDRSNPNNALNDAYDNNSVQRDDKIASSSASASLRRPPRNDNADNWQQHLIPIKTVLVSGTFDGVHQGHRNYFQQARQLGQRLICIVARDQIAEQIKGRRPRYSEKERLKFVKECTGIDRVYLGIVGNQSQIYDFTASFKPDIIALGYDQTAYTANLKEEMKKRGVAVKIVRLNPYMAEKYHSSIINH